MKKQSLVKYDKEGKMIIPEWLESLGNKGNIAFHVLNNGYESKDEIINAIESGEIGIKKSGGATVDGLGKVKIKELKLWLGIEETKTSDSAIKNAIALLERNGYSVEKKT